MRTTSQTGQFRKDYRREAKGQHRATLDGDLLAVLSILVNDQTLLDRYRDHALAGEYTKHRECHLKPDLLLVYKKPDDTTLRLVPRPADFVLIAPRSYNRRAKRNAEDGEEIRAEDAALLGGLCATSAYSAFRFCLASIDRREPNHAVKVLVRLGSHSELS